MKKSPDSSVITVKVYHGYGHTDNLVVYGHVLRGKPFSRIKYTDNIVHNTIHLSKLFFVNPLPNVRVQLLWRDQPFNSITEPDGFFKFEWQSSTSVSAGWHPVVVQALDADDQVLCR